MLELAFRAILLARLGLQDVKTRLTLLKSSKKRLYQLFDIKWYRESNPDLAAHQATLLHYVTRGWTENRSPHPFFSVEYYFQSRPDVRRARREPLAHFLLHGWKEGVNPHPLFDVQFYLSQHPNLGDLDPLTHYIQFGAAEGLRINSRIDYSIDLYSKPARTEPPLSVANDAWFLIQVDNPLGYIVMTDFGAAFGIYGYVHSRKMRLISAKLVLKQKEISISARTVFLETGMIDPHLCGTLEPHILGGLDGGFYISATFPCVPDIHDGLAYVEATLKWNNEVETVLRLCAIRVERAERQIYAGSSDGTALVGIAMATYNPDPILFERQIESIRKQTYTNWFCLISDDSSDCSYYANMLRVIGSDGRFAIRKRETKLGFYRNFECALACLPAQCAYVAFSDQDDVWKPNKVADQVSQLSSQDCECVYSDMQIVSSTGSILSPTFFVHRDRTFGSLSGLLLANTTTGMAMLFSDALRETALPFPATPNMTYHDHWVALIAESNSSLKYNSNPLVEYVQHGGNHTGALRPPERTRDALRRISKRTISILSTLLDLDRRPEFRAILSEARSWTDLEPCRLKILASSLMARRRNDQVTGAMAKMVRMTEKFSFTDILAAGASWRDRYRRSYSVELINGQTLKSLIRIYLDCTSPRAKHQVRTTK